MNITLRISRFIPGHIDPPRFETHEIDVSETATVLAVLERIRLERDSSLMYRRSCHHSACGTCALKVNGLESLACITEIASLNTSEIRLEPLDGFERLGDLVVDIAPLFDHFSEQWGSLRPISKQPDHSDAEKEDSRVRFEDCIECAACVSACPVSESANTFKGPAALAALEREIEKHPGSKSDLLKLAAGRDGAKGCRRALLCSRVCPTGVYPARSIYDLLKLLDR